MVRDHNRLLRITLRKLSSKPTDTLTVLNKSVCWREEAPSDQTIAASRKTTGSHDAAEVVHVLAGFVHGGLLCVCSEKRKVRPQGCAQEAHMVDRHRITVQEMDVHLPRNFSQPVDEEIHVVVIELVVACDVDDVLGDECFARPAQAVDTLGNVTRKHHCVDIIVDTAAFLNGRELAKIEVEVDRTRSFIDRPCAIARR